MTKFINGKRYRTGNGEMIYCHSNCLPDNDDNRLTEVLYVTKKGNYFIYGTGGAKTKYAVSHGETSSGSEDIIPLTKDEAFRWLAELNRNEEIELFFWELIEDA